MDLPRSAPAPTPECLPGEVVRHALCRPFLALISLKMPFSMPYLPGRQWCLRYDLLVPVPSIRSHTCVVTPNQRIWSLKWWERWLARRLLSQLPWRAPQ
jgi:hypothetical protein